MTVGSSSDKTTTLYNDGTGTLTINSITRSSGSSDFIYIGPSTPFNISAGSSQAITVRFSPSSAGSKSATFNVNSNDPDEGNAPFNVSGTGATVSLPTVIITAPDNTATENPLTTGTFTASRTGSTTSSLTVYYSISGTATAGSDYISLPGSITIPAGSTSANITVTPINDTLIESNETVIATLSSNPAYTMGFRKIAIVTIISDDPPPKPVVTVTAQDATATEAGPTTGTYRISRTGSTASSLSVYFTMSGSATSGVDYQTITSPKTIPTGSSYVDVTLTPINDSTYEADETAVLTLSPNPAYTMGFRKIAIVTIISDD